jgi:CheY-like chemotaxis protein
MAAAPYSVLIVEDNPDGAESLAIVLKLLGYAPRVARTGEDAVRMAREDPPDGAIIDVGLPGIDGCEVARRIRAMPGGGPLLVAVSGYTHLEEECRAAGIDHYLIKPADVNLIDSLFKSHARRRSRAE